MWNGVSKKQATPYIEREMAALAVAFVRYCMNGVWEEHPSCASYSE